jgi:predicted aspartyl protease
MNDRSSGRQPGTYEAKHGKQCSRRTYSSVCLLAFLFFTFSSALAQQIVRITIDNDGVLVPVRVNGQNLAFILDTGSESSAIDVSAAQRLGLTRVGDAELEKNYREQETNIVAAQSLSIGHKVVEHENLAAVPLNSISAALGATVDGVLGNDILQGFAFQLNYSKQELIYGPLSKLGNVGTAVRLRRSGDQFFVPVHLLSVPIDLLLDTGANSTNLSWGTWQKLKQLWEPHAVIDGVVRAGAPTPPAFLVCLPNVSLGNAMLSDQVVRIQRPVDSGVFSLEGFAGIMGTDLLRQFDVTFDLAHDHLYLKKDAQFKRDPYRYTTIGMQFAKDSTNRYTVVGVWKNSPAKEAGIRIGDHILAVNGRASESLSSNQLAGQLHGEEGTPVNLTMERGSVVSAVALRTRQMLCASHHSPNSLRASQK